MGLMNVTVRNNLIQDMHVLQAAAEML